MSLEISTSPLNFKEQHAISNTDTYDIKPNEYNQFERQPINDVVTFENEENNSNMTKSVILGILGLGAIAALSDFVFAKGKHVKKILGMTEKGVKDSVESKASSTEQTLKDLKSKGGKFSDKKLLDKDGNTFSGKLVHEGKDNRKYVLEYKDGLIQKAECFQKGVSGDIPLGTKSFTYNSKDKIASVTKESIVMDKGNVKNVKKFEYNSDGKIKSVIDESKEKIIDKPFETYFNYDSKGNLISVRTKTEKFINGKTKTVEETKKVKTKKKSDNDTKSFKNRMSDFWSNIKDKLISLKNKLLFWKKDI